MLAIRGTNHGKMPGGILDLDMFAQNLVDYDDRVGSVSWVHWGSGTDALAVAEASYRSAAEGRPVPVEAG